MLVKIKYISCTFSTTEIQSRFRSIVSGEKRNRGYLLPGKEGQVEKRRNCSRSIWKSPSKVKSGRFSRACRYSTRRKRRRGATWLFLLLASNLVLYIHEIVVSSSLKGIRISRVGVLGITFPSVPRAP